MAQGFVRLNKVTHVSSQGIHVTSQALELLCVRAKITQSPLRDPAQRHVRRAGAEEMICFHSSSVKEILSANQAAHTESRPGEQRLLHRDDQAPRYPTDSSRSGHQIPGLSLINVLK